MKVIDVLNMWANGEDVIVKDEEGYFANVRTLMDNLNSKVEIVEDTPKEESINSLINTIKTHIPKPPKEDKKIKRIEERESGWWPNMADGNVSTLKQAINEIIDRLNGKDNEF